MTESPRPRSSGTGPAHPGTATTAVAATPGVDGAVPGPTGSDTSPPPSTDGGNPHHRPHGPRPVVATAAGDGAASNDRPSVKGLGDLWRVRALRRLVLVRLLSSFGDGAFQGALAVIILFSPERQTEPAAIAAGFAVLLLPYSLVGPFAGALLDRWSRRQVIVWATVLRAVLVLLAAAQVWGNWPSPVLFGTALLIMGVGRFVGSGLSASMPHTVARDSLVGANALATTVGAVATAIGGGYAIALRSALGGSVSDAAFITATVAVFYGLAALLATRYRRTALGPDETDEPAEPLRAVLLGFTSGLRHIVQRPTVGLAVVVVMIVRFGFGLCTMVVLLLFQHYFTESQGVLRTGPSGIAEVLGFGALGVFLGAVVTAPTVRKLGRTRWVAIMLSVCAIVAAAAGSQFTLISTLIAAFVVGFAYQSSKVCMDSVVQQDSDDAYVGRVFALYDTLNNVCYVGAFALGVLLVPYNGYGYAPVFLVGGLFLVTGLGYAWGMQRIQARRAAVDR